MRPISLAPALACGLSLVSGDAGASNYPPDYPICSVTETLYAGPFEAIRRLVDPWDSHVQLTIAYDGYLRDEYADDEINIYIRLNGHDALIEASPGTHDDAYIFLDSGPRACTWCANGNVPYNQSSACQGIVFGPYESGRWVCGQPNQVEQHLFFWAFNQNGDLNAWDIELAAEAGGEWDSNYGANFDVRFEPRGCW
jgi:hypothetical protein